MIQASVWVAIWASPVHTPWWAEQTIWVHMRGVDSGEAEKQHTIRVQQLRPKLFSNKKENINGKMFRNATKTTELLIHFSFSWEQTERHVCCLQQTHEGTNRNSHLIWTKYQKPKRPDGISVICEPVCWHAGSFVSSMHQKPINAQ